MQKGHDLTGNQHLSSPDITSPQQPQARRQSATTRFALLGIFILPFAFVPYAFMRRRVSVLQQRLDDLTTTTSELQRSTRTLALQSSHRKDELARARLLLEAERKEVDELRCDLKATRDEYAIESAAIQSHLHKLLEESKVTKTRLTVLSHLGVSLADIAAFMHENKLRHGPSPLKADDYGVERLRALAMQIQKAAFTTDKDS
ncbi:hypothetical protein SERLA73DRAFT_177111 [Serpula lacrymans var. lacrymans S7.3]|uniref:Uncharacterized protein n=2 Tax=Serpula lacrymans var. lacrymans TaxID=341189 RepID=F8PR26_SERL3|nr:uncharacterized protein SERLADRAFT_460549 [Serpula lacrymans var. lacrymans S7.9]EGO01683.1 hypothetical protein SERLA73DRAFT_177111 [Serpula lacrymans var. lacrymans S7.3]EGO27326.1 hypothetical protein SERLADRAFT_460549 [Serpula lacrymans var. lacrymans S7.9]